MVPRPSIVAETDIIVRVTQTAICGSDLHLYGGLIATIKKGDILGHEVVGVVDEVGSRVHKVAVGDRVLVSAIIACGTCYFCNREEFAFCDVDGSNNASHVMPEKVTGYVGFGGQAEYVRVPFADVGAFKIPATLSDDQVLFLTDVFPTGWMAAENCDIKRGETVAIWGCGPVGQFAIRSAVMMGAGQVIAIDSVPERLAMAATAGAVTLNYEKDNILEELKTVTFNRGPDCCIDAVGMEAHGGTGFTERIMDAVDKAKQFVMMENDRPAAIRQILRCCRKGGRVSIPGVYSGLVDTFPLGFAFNKGLTLRMGPTHMHKYIPMLLDRVSRKEIDPSFLTTHKIKLDDAAHAYEIFKKKEDGCIKVVLMP